jgi:hypothetical protein
MLLLLSAAKCPARGKDTKCVSSTLRDVVIGSGLEFEDCLFAVVSSKG